MKAKTFFIGAITGAAAGIFSSYIIQKKVKPSAEKILKNIKLSLKEEGSIIGSWILCKPEKIYKNHMEYDIYQGGLTLMKDGKQIQYEFQADANTGTLIELKRMNQ